MTDGRTSNKNLLRTVALTASVIGAVGSLYFMFEAGSEQKSIVLMTLFTGWVLSPFAGLFIANKISSRWTTPARSYLYWLMLILSIISLIAYSGVLTPPDAKPAFLFLIVPLTSWFFIVTVFFIAKRISNRI